MIGRHLKTGPLWLVLLFGFLLAPAYSETTLQLAAPEAAGFSSDKITALNAAMHDAVDKGEVAGIVTLLARHGKIIDFDAYGKQSLKTGVPMAKDTIFRMYSQTKPLTGVAMMILYEEGKWKLGDPITAYIPEFDHLKVLASLDAKGQPVLEGVDHVATMRELMTHTAGFGYGLRNDDYVDQQFQSQQVLRSKGLQDMIDKVANIPLLYQPGRRWSYSVAVDVQGYVIEELTKESLADFMAEHIFKPLGMVDTGFMVPPDKVSRLAAVYVKSPTTGALVEVTPAMSPAVQDFTKPPLMDSGGGGSVSTAEDYARFCQMMLNGGEYDGVRILKPETVRLMETDALEPTVTAQSPTGQHIAIGGEAIGFGLDMAVLKDPAKAGSRAGAGSVWWGGAAGTWFWIDPKNDLFFIGLIQRFGRGDAGNEGLIPTSQQLVYSALTDPAK